MFDEIEGKPDYPGFYVITEQKTDGPPTPTQYPDLTTPPTPVTCSLHYPTRSCYIWNTRVLYVGSGQAKACHPSNTGVLSRLSDHFNAALRYLTLGHASDCRCNEKPNHDALAAYLGPLLEAPNCHNPVYFRWCEFEDCEPKLIRHANPPWNNQHTN